MTERIYYTDPYRTDFTATVVASTVEGDHRIVMLDRTAFYPASGGQPFDIGALNGFPVVEVTDRDEGIAHLVQGSLEVGDIVRGVVDWRRRFDHMQQHTGQHVLSAAFDRLHGAGTESFHLGAETCTIDLGREIPADAIASAESEANQIVWEDRPVHVRFVEAGDAAKMPLRKETGRTGTLRIIEVDGYDTSACGGTHVARTGAIGMIAVISTERFRGGVRVSFVCGGRALHALRQLKSAVDASVRLLSVLPAELPPAIERLQTDSRDLRRAQKTMTEQLAEYEAQALAQQGVRIGSTTCVVRAVDGADANRLKSLAAAIATNASHCAVLVTSIAPYLVVAARSADVSLDSSRVVRSLIDAFGGRGGGRPELAQGGGLQGSVEEILVAATRAVEQQVTR